MKQIEQVMGLIYAVKSRPSPYNGMLKSSDAKVIQNSYDQEINRHTASIDRIRRDAKLDIPGDERFARYWEGSGGYHWRKEQAQADQAIMVVPGEGRYTSYTLLVTELKSELKAAVARVRGNELQQS